MSRVVPVDCLSPGSLAEPLGHFPWPRRSGGRRAGDNRRDIPPPSAPSAKEAEKLADAESILVQRDRMIAVFGHDLRGLLNALTVNSEVFLRQEGGPAMNSAEVVRRTIGRMDQLVSSLLDYVRVKAQKLTITPESVDAVELLREAVEIFRPLADSKSLSIIIAVPGSPFWMIADRNRIFQVLSNLLSNAIKFSTVKGEITIQVTTADEGLGVAIRDEGIGIPEADLMRVFDCFHQLEGQDAGGLGLGLYISRSIILAHGGRIWATSRVGAGSTFYFTIPSCRETRVEASDAPA